MLKVVDEPTAASYVLGITDGVVVDLGGGTTGISILEKGKVVFVADEPTGGTHMTLVLAGSYGVDFETAEDIKTDKKKEKEAKGYQVEMTAEEAKTEKEKLANMTEDEKLKYKVDKAKEKIDNMLDIAKKARQEEIEVEETKNQVEEALKNITEEK